MRLIAFCLAALLSGCGQRAPTSISDPYLTPMLKAIAAFDRTSLGFSPVPTNGDVQLEEGGKAPYDAMLHIYADTSRTVAFRKTTDGYRWISEQELHYGPKRFTTIDGAFQEHLVVEYQLEPVNGIPTNQINISYYGPDPRLTNQANLTLPFIKPILDEWKGTKWR